MRPARSSRGGRAGRRRLQAYHSICDRKIAAGKKSCPTSKIHPSCGCAITGRNKTSRASCMNTRPGWRFRHLSGRTTGQARAWQSQTWGKAQATKTTCWPSGQRGPAEPGEQPEPEPREPERRRSGPERSRPEPERSRCQHRSTCSGDDGTDHHNGDGHRSCSCPSTNHCNHHRNHHRNHCNRGSRDRPSPCCCYRPTGRCRRPRKRSRCQRSMHDSFQVPPLKLNRYRTVRTTNHIPSACLSPAAVTAAAAGQPDSTSIFVLASATSCPVAKICRLHRPSRIHRLGRPN
jgi:hypothetical protein